MATWKTTTHPLTWIIHLSNSKWSIRSSRLRSITPITPSSLDVPGLSSSLLYSPLLRSSRRAAPFEKSRAGCNSVRGYRKGSFRFERPDLQKHQPAPHRSSKYRHAERSDEDLLEDAWTKANPYLDLIDLIDPSPEAYGHEDFIPEYLAEVSEFIEMAKGYADISESDLFEFYEPSVDVYATAAGIGSGDANPKSMPYPGSLTDADEKDGDPISRDQDILLASAELGRDPRPEDIAKSNVAIYAPRMPEGVQLIHAVQVPRSKAVEPDWCSFYEVPTSSANVEETRVGGSGDLVKGKLKAGEDERKDQMPAASRFLSDYFPHLQRRRRRPRGKTRREHRQMLERAKDANSEFSLYARSLRAITWAKKRNRRNRRGKAEVRRRRRSTSIPLGTDWGDSLWGPR